VARAREVRGLRCEEPFRTAAGKIIWTRFEELISFREAVLESKGDGDRAEAVHDMRVASRRVRAALELFEDVFPRRQFTAMLRDVKTLADSLGSVRDLDVMIERLEKSRRSRIGAQRVVLDGIVADLRAELAGARQDLATAIEDLEASDFPRRFAAFVAQSTT